jgi:hypothetical protein
MDLLGTTTHKGPREREGGGAQMCVVLKAEDVQVESLHENVGAKIRGGIM